jgi:3-deoxy-D-manno-octulosonic-acid transferase
MKHRSAHLFTNLYSGILEAGRAFVFPPAATMKAAAGWNLRERCDVPPPKNSFSGAPSVWIHAPSLGASKLLAKFLETLRRKHPGARYVVTAATRTGVAYLQSLDSDDIVGAGFFPLDTIGLMKKMLRVFAVTRVWLMETELWPSMMLACKQSGVPVGIVNARMEEKSFAFYRRLKILYGPLLSSLDAVLAQDGMYARRFELLGVRPEVLRVIGNLKAVVVIRPPSAERRRTLRSALGLCESDFVLTAGCVHAGEAGVLREALEILRPGAPLRCIVVPRHLDETETILRALGPETLRIAGTETSVPWKVCVIDKMGVLEDMYAVASAAFIGGTFDSTGGHNVWDAAQFAVPVLFGPDYHTQLESCELLLRTGAAFSAASAQDLSRIVARLHESGEGGFTAAFSAVAAFFRERMGRIEGVVP